MKKYLITMVAMIAMAFCFTSCGSDDDDKMNFNVTEIKEEGGRMFFSGLTNKYDIDFEIIVSAYFGKDELCESADVTCIFVNEEMAKMTYVKYISDGTNPNCLTLDGTKMIQDMSDIYKGKDKEFMRIELEQTRQAMMHK